MKRWVRRIALALGLLVVLAAGVFVFMMGARNVIGMLRYDTREEGDLKVGHAAPDVALVALDGSRVRLQDKIGAKPLVLVFGSFT